MPLSVSLDLALLFNSPGQLAAGWALMVVAMMLPLDDRAAVACSGAEFCEAASAVDAALRRGLHCDMDDGRRGAAGDRAAGAMGRADAAGLSWPRDGRGAVLANLAGQAVVSQPLSPAAAA